MKRIATGLAVAAASVALATPVAAGNDNGPPPGLDEDIVLDCDAVQMSLHSGEGRSGWLDGGKWAIVTIETNYEGETVYAKTYGHGPKGETLDCTFEDGPVELFVTVVNVQ